MLKKKNNAEINSLFKASIYYIFGNVIGQGTVLLSTILFTRMMSKADYGEYSTYYSLVTILTTIVGANLFIGLNSAYLDYKEKIREFRASVLFLSTLVLGVVSIIVCALKALSILNWSWFVVFIALAHSYAFFIINYFNYSANMENRYIAKTVLLILPNVLQIVFSVIAIFIFSQNKLEARMVGSMLGILVCACFVFVKISLDTKKIVVPEYWKYALKISVPSVLSSISYMIMQQSDKIMITNIHGSEETAVYSVAYYIGYALYAILQATSGVWQAWIYRALDSGKTHNIKQLQKWYLIAFLVMAFGLFMIAPEVIKLLSPKSYWNFDYVPPFILGSCLMLLYTFYTTIGLFYKKSGMVSAVVFFSAVVNVILNYLLIPKFGGLAASYTTVVAYFILFLLSRAMIQRINPGIYSGKYFTVFLIALILGSILFLYVYPYTLIRYIVYFLIIMIAGIYVATKRKEVFELIGMKK